MLQTIREKAAGLLAAGEVGGVLGLCRDTSGAVQPRLFREAAELAGLAIAPKWNLAKLAAQLLRDAAAPSRMAVLCRGCDGRALVELAKRNQVDPARVVAVGYTCSREQAAACLCTRPWPEGEGIGERADGVDPFADPRFAALLTGDAGERMARWTALLGRCIKCYGCRNACPICLCSPCKLEEDLWVERSALPAELIPHHLIRAFHLADTCVACGACQEACPVGIPLLALQLGMRRSLQETYGYEAGRAAEGKSPLLQNFAQAAPADLTLPAWTASNEEPHER